MFMRFALATIVTTLSLQSLTTQLLAAANPTTQNPQSTVAVVAGTPSPTPLDLLKVAINVARQGDVQGGIAKAKDAKQLGQQNGQFGSMMVVEYLNTLSALLELAQLDQKDNLLNESLATIDQFKASSEFDGRGNAQVAYYFMLSIKKIAESVMADNETVYLRLQQHQGGIARNLTQNPAYPVDGRQFLADPLIGMASGLALEKNIDGAKAAISEACQLGFCEFDKLAESKVWKKIKDIQELDGHLAQLRTKYIDSLKDWSLKELKEFEGFRFTFHLDSIRGGTLSSRDFEGKILVVELWATWCEPCRETIPHFQQLSKEFRKFDVRVLGISMDSPDDPNQSVETVREFLAEHEIRFPCGMGSNELKNRLPAEMKLPTTLFIDRSGTVRYMATGYQDYAKIAAITEALVNEAQPVNTAFQSRKLVQ